MYYPQLYVDNSLQLMVAKEYIEDGKTKFYTSSMRSETRRRLLAEPGLEKEKEETVVIADRIIRALARGNRVPRELEKYSAGIAGMARRDANQADKGEKWLTYHIRKALKAGDEREYITAEPKKPDRKDPV